MTTWIDELGTEDEAGVNGLLIAAFGRGAEMVCRPETFTRSWDLARRGLWLFGAAAIPDEPAVPACGPGEQIRILMARVDPLRSTNPARTVTRVTVEPVPPPRELNVATAPTWLPDLMQGLPLLMNEAHLALRGVTDDVLVCRNGLVQSCGGGAVVAWQGDAWCRMHADSGAVEQPNVGHLSPRHVQVAALPPMLRVGGGGDISPIICVDGIAAPAAPEAFP